MGVDHREQGVGAGVEPLLQVVDLGLEGEEFLCQVQADKHQQFVKRGAWGGLLDLLHFAVDVGGKLLDELFLVGGADGQAFAAQLDDDGLLGPCWGGRGGVRGGRRWTALCEKGCLLDCEFMVTSV